MASTMAGIAFGNAGCAAVHAMSYPLGAEFHIPHGESNYAMFTGVFKKYMEIAPDGGIKELNEIIAAILECAPEGVYEEIETLLNSAILQKKSLHEYGMTEKMIEEFADSVIANQQRLLANNYVFLDRAALIDIYTKLF
jgi:4-hydroxybutyrate dehydrogenase